MKKFTKLPFIKEKRKKKDTYSVQTRVDNYVSNLLGRWETLTNCKIQSKYINIFTIRVLHKVLGTDPKLVLPEPKSSKYPLDI